METVKIFEQLGLSSLESRLYEEMLRHVNVSPAVLARRVRASRPSVYDALRSLTKKGLIYETHQKKTKTYAAKDPRTLETLIDAEEAEATNTAEKKRAVLSAAMPDLLRFAKGATLLPKIQLFEGEQGIWNALQETLNTQDIIRAYANIDDIVTSMGDAFERYLKQRTTKNIHARAIAPNTAPWRERLKKSKEEMRDVRFITSSAEYSPEINIFDDRVLMISWKENFAILITSKDFAHAQRVIYDELWEKLTANTQDAA